MLTVVQVRIPLADATAMKAPEGIDDKALVLMADIFPTGCPLESCCRDLD